MSSVYQQGRTNRDKRFLCLSKSGIFSAPPRFQPLFYHVLIPECCPGNSQRSSLRRVMLAVTLGDFRCHSNITYKLPKCHRPCSPRHRGYNFIFGCVNYRNNIVLTVLHIYTVFVVKSLHFQSSIRNKKVVLIYCS